MSLNKLSSLLSGLNLTCNYTKISILGAQTQIREMKIPPKPRIRYPYWYQTQSRVKYNEDMTPENEAFVKEMVQERYGAPTKTTGYDAYNYTPLKHEPTLRGTWFPGCRRSGVIAKKIGVYPQWKSDGTKFLTTLLQVVDNHVIKYIPPEDYVVHRKKRSKRFKKEGQLGCLVVGAVSSDPQQFTKEYCGLFANSGVMPKKILTRFPIHPAAAIQPGTPLTAAHFQIGEVVDVMGVTIDRGFQGVMKKWGFHGQPASHGQTKTHRRPGNIGGGGEKGRVWPGKKLPGHMGNKHRTLRGLKIWRMNHKYNVIWVTGPAIPGDVNTFVYVHDTVLPLRWLKESPRFPTFYPEDHEGDLPDEEFDQEVFDLSQPTIMFQEEKVQMKK